MWLRMRHGTGGYGVLWGLLYLQLSLYITFTPQLEGNGQSNPALVQAIYFAKRQLDTLVYMQTLQIDLTN